jgi:hypothetical protein
MDTTLSTKNSYFDYYIDRSDKPDNQDYTMLTPKGRRLFWNLKFNYPGKYNLRIQLYMPSNLSKLKKKSVAAGFWTSGETKLSERCNVKEINNNDTTQPLFWYDIGSYDVTKVGVKCFYIEKLRSGNPFGISKICFEYCEDGTEEFDNEESDELKKHTMTLHDKIMKELYTYYNEHDMLEEVEETNQVVELNEFENIDTTQKVVNVNTETPISISSSNDIRHEDSNSEEKMGLDSNDDVVNSVFKEDAPQKTIVKNNDFKLQDYEPDTKHIYKKNNYVKPEPVNTSSKLDMGNLLPKGLKFMIDEIVPNNEEERETMYHAKPAFLFTKADETIDEIGGVYREMKVTKHVHFTLYTMSFPGVFANMVYDESNGYISFEIGKPDEKCSLIDNNPKSSVTATNNIQITYPYQFKEGINYKVFIRTKTMMLYETEHTVYYLYFGIAKNSKWNFVGAVARPGKHNPNSVSSSIENVGTFNGHLYTRKLVTGNTWVFDKCKNSTLINSMTFVSQDPNNSYVQIYKNNRIELQIGGRYGGDYKDLKQEFLLSITGKKHVPTVPWDSVDTFN